MNGRHKNNENVFFDAHVCLLLEVSIRGIPNVPNNVNQNHSGEGKDNISAWCDGLKFGKDKRIMMQSHNFHLQNRRKVKFMPSHK